MKNKSNKKKSQPFKENLLGIITLDNTGEKIIQISLPSNKKTLHGYTENELSDITVATIFHVDVIDIFNQYKKNENHFFFSNVIEWKVLKKNGKSKLVLAKFFRTESNKIIIAFYDISNRIKSEYKLLDKLNYEKALAKASKYLMSDKRTVNDALQELLVATKASRVYIFKNSINEDGELCMSQIYEQCSEGVEPQIDNPVLQNLSYTALNDRWYRHLSVNKIIKGHLHELDKEEQEILEAQGVESIIVLPIWNRKGWFGYIGFDSVGKKRKWKNLDLRLLKLFAEMLGSYFLNQEYKQTLEEQNIQLKKLLETQNKFLSIISHDLKNPFRQIMSFSRLIEKKIEERDFESVNDFNKNIKSASEKTFNLLNSLLEWSKVTKGDFDYNPETFKLSQFVESVIINFNEAALLKNVTIENTIDNNIEVFADKKMMQIVLNNLISNSIKFSYENGEIQISSFSDENGVTLSVKDYGKGIASENLANLFQLGKNVSTQGTKGETGSGLGLHLCKEFVERNHGRIEILSEENKGCETLIYLPKVN